jgi:hypothetical protein
MVLLLNVRVLICLKWPGQIIGFQPEDKANFVPPHRLTNLGEPLKAFIACLPAMRESSAVNRVD